MFEKIQNMEPFAKLFRSWFDRLTTNGISASYIVNPFALSLSKGFLQKALINYPAASSGVWLQHL